MYQGLGYSVIIHVGIQSQKAAPRGQRGANESRSEKNYPGGSHDRANTM